MEAETVGESFGDRLWMGLTHTWRERAKARNMLKEGVKQDLTGGIGDSVLVEEAERKRAEKLAKWEDDQQKKRESRNERVKKAEAEVSKMAADNALIGMTADEKRNELVARRVSLLEKLKHVQDEADALGLDNEEEELGLQKEITGLDGDIAKLDGAASKASPHVVSSLQQMGGFLGNFSAAGIQNMSPELALHQKNERHLSEAVRLLKVLSKGGTPGREETEY